MMSSLNGNIAFHVEFVDLSKQKLKSRKDDDYFVCLNESQSTLDFMSDVKDPVEFSSFKLIY
jgi:hypothetical protein